MAAELGEAFVPIRATLDKLDGDLAKAKGAIQGALGNLKSAGMVALGAAAGAASIGIGLLATGLGIAVSEAMGAQEIMAQTQAVIKSTGSAAGMTAEQIATMATALSTQSRFSDDAIQSGENLLLTFTNIGSDVFPAATQAMVDMATAMGTDASSGAIQLGKALNDPTAGISALTRVGVTFTDEQKKVIKALQDSGDVAGAQKIILAELNKEFGGSASAAAETFAGKMDVLKNKLLNVAEAIGGPLLSIGSGLIDKFIAPAIPLVESLASAFTDNLNQAISDVTAMIAAGESPLDIFSTAIGDMLPPDLLQRWIDFQPTIDNVIASVQAFIETAKPIVAQVLAWLQANVTLQDVLIALGVAIAVVVIPAIASVVAAVAPVILTFAAVIAIAALLRQAWENDWGGIQEKTAAVWAVLQPLLAQAQAWLGVNLPIALKALSDFWVNVAWPAIQNAIEVAWPIIQAIFSAMVDFIQNVTIPLYTFLFQQWTTVWWPAISSALASAWAFIQPILINLVAFVRDTLIPGILDLYTKWTTVWWPTIQTVLTNVWTVIEGVFKELDRWLNVNIIPWINELNRIWSTVVWPAIQSAVEAFWKVVQPILKDVKDWLDTNIPVAVKALQPIFEGVMSGISGAVTPVKTAWDGFVSAVTEFWNWISSHVFSFSIHLPDLPDWAVPGSPLPIHTAWKAFAADVSRMNIAPRIDMGGLLPVQSTTEDGGGDRSIHFSSTTTVQTNQDPMRVLRASRHLDKLGALT